MKRPTQSGEDPDAIKNSITSTRNASATSDFPKTSANPRFQRRRSHRRPRRRKVANAAKLRIFLPVLYVGLVAFLHWWGIVAPAVYLVLGQIFLAVLGKMPPPPAGEDDGSNYTLQA